MIPAATALYGYMAASLYLAVRMGWREVVAEGYPAWVQPTGAHDAYARNEIVSYQGQNWQNTGSDANVWEPGVFGWVVVP